jgi:hypothetical protein
MWPMTSKEVHSDNEATENKGVITFPSDWKMYISYSSGDAANIESRMNFPEGDWLAGKKYVFTLSFADKLVSLDCKVADWDYVEQNVNLGSDIDVDPKLSWSNTESDIDEVKKEVTIKDGKPAVGTFTINEPKGATWLASLTGDINAFDISPKSGIINGESATILVTPKIDSPKRDYKVKVRFAVRLANGTVIPAAEINPSDDQYSIVLSGK